MILSTSQDIQVVSNTPVHAIFLLSFCNLHKVSMSAQNLTAINKQSNKQSHIHYALKVANATEHLFEVCMFIQLTKSDSASSIELALPAWIPGSYMIRDFARNIHRIECPDNNVDMEQLDKQTWKLRSKDGQTINCLSVSYFVYANDLSVRSAFINDEYAFFNGTSVFLSIKHKPNITHKVSILDWQNKLTSQTNNIATSMPPLPESRDNEPLTQQAACQHPLVKESYDCYTHYICKDYYDLIEHPAIIGQFEQHSFTVNEHTFNIVFTGDNGLNLARIEKDLRPIIAHHISLFNEFPCEDYWFLTLLCNNGFGGLEHTASTVLHYSRNDLPTLGDSNYSNQSSELTINEPGYQTFLSLCSHELFHTWHVKRIKPLIMHQPNLSHEVYTPQLWIYEGFTSLYDDLSLARSKLISPERYVEILNSVFSRLLRSPGRFSQSVSQSSFEAWSKFYKQDAGSINHIVSYYNKGTVVALCLDIHLRQLTNNEYGLDHVMQHLWNDYGKPNIGTTDNVITTLCKKYFDVDIQQFLYVATETTMDLPIANSLEYIGLKLHLRSMQTFADKGEKAVKPSNNLIYDLGFNAKNHNGFLKVLSVQSSRAGSQAGLKIDDLIIAIDAKQCNDHVFINRLACASENEQLSLHVLRDGRLIRLDYPVLPAVFDTADIKIEDEVLFEKWLGISTG